LKKRIVTLLLICVMALSFAIPVTANEILPVESVNVVGEQEITPHTEMTRMYWRNHQGQLQWRLWSITNGRWLSEWTTVHPA